MTWLKRWELIFWQKVKWISEEVMKYAEDKIEELT